MGAACVVVPTRHPVCPPLQILHKQETLETQAAHGPWYFGSDAAALTEAPLSTATLPAQ